MHLGGIREGQVTRWQDRGEASKRRGETEAALLLPRGEASASRHPLLQLAINFLHVHSQLDIRTANFLQKFIASENSLC